MDGVIRNAFKGFKKAGGFAARRNVWIMAGSLLLDALNKDKSGKPLPEEKRYRYDEERGRIVRKGTGHFACIYRIIDGGVHVDNDKERNWNGRVRADECAAYIGTPMLIDYVEPDPNETYVEDELSSDQIANYEIQDNAKRLLCLTQNPPSYVNEGFTFVGFEYDKNGTCHGKFKGESGTIIKLWYASFVFGEGLVGHSVWDGTVPDNAPDERINDWVKASVNDDDTLPDVQNKITVPNGTVAQSAPYTRDGKAYQTRWDFATDGNGNTNVRETETPRPDLKPGSSAAPNLPPQPTGGINNGGGTSDSPATGGTPGTDGSNTTLPGIGNSPDDSNSPNNSPDTGNGGASTPKPPATGLCDQYPDILACDRMGQPEESMFDDGLGLITSLNAVNTPNRYTL